MEIKICDVIKKKRCEMGVSQEVLAEWFGISVQAVSKWETKMSMPDIALLPQIAERLEISMDELFFGIKPAAAAGNVEFPDDGKLRVVQFAGNTMLKEGRYDPNVRIMLEIPENRETEFNVEILGSADIDGDVNGYVTAKGCINCGNVGQSAYADDNINCGHIGQSATAGDSINCGNVGQSATAGDSITCGDIAGDAEAQNGDIHCKIIKGSASCGGDIIYEK